MAKEPTYALTQEARSRLISDYVARAFALQKDAKGQFRENRYPEAVSTVQEGLEFVVKALFHEASIPPPKSHRMRDARFRDPLTRLSQAFKARLTVPKWGRLNLPRVFFILNFWGEFYLDAKYGSELLGASPSQLFRREEAELALAHLEWVLEVLTEVFVD